MIPMKALNPGDVERANKSIEMIKLKLETEYEKK